MISAVAVSWYGSTQANWKRCRIEMVVSSTQNGRRKIGSASSVSGNGVASVTKILCNGCAAIRSRSQGYFERLSSCMRRRAGIPLTKPLHTSAHSTLRKGACESRNSDW